MLRLNKCIIVLLCYFVLHLMEILTIMSSIHTYAGAPKQMPLLQMSFCIKGDEVFFGDRDYGKILSRNSREMKVLIISSKHFSNNKVITIDL